ncbi:MAG TPA: ferrous iron transport protein B [Steroidobacteraceae bacterium]|jgi:ferrous iron transport protein B|nr:ferrous iron transport protein B [Steroidobacteraceae bacterium]
MNAAVGSAEGVSLSLIGVPNCGKTALFNRLTGSRQKVANYPGVTVERKEGRFIGPNTGRLYRLLDLPGAYSLEPTSLDEAIARDVVLGRHATEPPPDLLVCVVDATNLRLNLRLVLDLKRLGRPMIVALNMSDLARSRGYRIDRAALERALGVPVVETIAVQPGGEKALVDAIDRQVFTRRIGRIDPPVVSASDVVATQREVRRILDEIGYRVPARLALLSKLDSLVLHPIGGPALLAIVLFLMFQAVFSWAAVPMDAIEAGVAKIGEGIGAVLPEGPLRSLLIDGVVAGVGSVLVFLPQILILFFFILVLEDSGYLPRAAFLLDRLMGKVGLSGRAFIPLLSSFACAVPGIMATRTIPSPRDRIATIMIAPLMTCSARLPVYALLIGAFIPERAVAGVFNLKGLVLFALYLAGVLSAMLVAFVLKLTVMRGQDRPLLMELPEYRMPNLRNLALGLWERVRIFLQRVGTIILTLMVVLWFLSSFPAPPPGATGPAIEYSVAGMLGRGLQYLFAPIGFNWQISIALVPGLAAREIAVGALGTVYSMSASGDDVAGALTPIIASTWSMATALSLLAWYVFAPQCLSTLAVVKRETNSWRYPLIMAGYLFALAYVASFVTYRVALMLGGG